MKKTPLQIVKEKYGEKAKLVEALKALAGEDLWVARTSADRGGDKALDNVSNAKLLRLVSTFTTVKEKFGTRAKLVDAILEVEKRVKDAGYKKRLEAYPVPRLFDHWKSASRRAKAGGAPPAAKPGSAGEKKKA